MVVYEYAGGRLSRMSVDATSEVRTRFLEPSAPARRRSRRATVAWLVIRDACGVVMADALASDFGREVLGSVQGAAWRLHRDTIEAWVWERSGL